MSDVSAEGARMEGVGSGMEARHRSSVMSVLGADNGDIQGEALPIFKNTLINEEAECSEGPPSSRREASKIRTHTHAHMHRANFSSVIYVYYVHLGMVWPISGPGRWINIVLLFMMTSVPPLLHLLLSAHKGVTEWRGSELGSCPVHESGPRYPSLSRSCAVVID